MESNPDLVQLRTERIRKQKKLHKRIEDLRRTFTNYKSTQDVENEQKTQAQRNEMFVQDDSKRVDGIEIIQPNLYDENPALNHDINYVLRIIQHQNRRIQSLEEIVMKIYNKTIKPTNT